jgi:hypothetical protein
MKIALVYSSDTQKGIVKGIEVLGHEVVPFYYGYNWQNKALHYLYKSVQSREKMIIQSFNNKLVDVDDSHLKHFFDVIIIVKGHEISNKTKAILQRKDIRKIQWTIDSVERCPGQSTLFPYMDKVFFQDGNDVQLHTLGEWLPLGFDQSLFRHNENKSIDILLMGNVKLPFYSKRRDCFARLAFLAKAGKKVTFAGSNPDKELLTIFKSNGVEISGRHNLKKYAELISKARICVNIHQDDGGKAINPMFFAIPATGGLELSDNTDYLTNWLTPNIHYFPTSPETIAEDIRPLLELRCLSAQLAKEVIEKHSYYARASNILSGIEKGFDLEVK